MRINFMNVKCLGDPDLGIAPFHKRMPLNIEVEDSEDLERFRNDIAASFATVLGDAVEVEFSSEIKSEVVRFDPIKPESNEPGIG